MGIIKRVRDTMTGRYVNQREAAARPGTTVTETSRRPHQVTEIILAASSVVQSRGYMESENRVSVSQINLARLQKALEAIEK